MKSIWLHELNWKQVTEYLKENDTLLLPVGSTETHGIHLPVGTDTLVPIRIAEDVGKKTNVLVAPPLWYGWTPHHLGHAGTASLTANTYIAAIKEISYSYIYHGFKKIVIVNGHREGNIPPLSIALSTIRNVTGAFMAIIDPFYIAASAVKDLRTSAPGGIGHGGEMETSHMLHLYPEFVDMSQAARIVGQKKKFRPIEFYDYDDRVITIGTAAEFNARTGSSGMTGDALMATEEKGKEYHKRLVDNVVEFVLEIKSLQVHLKDNLPLPF